MKHIEIKISNNEINYEAALLYMKSRVDDISKNKSKELLWFLNHNHIFTQGTSCLLYTSPSPRDMSASRMPSSA